MGYRSFIDGQILIANLSEQEIERINTEIHSRDMYEYLTITKVDDLTTIFTPSELKFIDLDKADADLLNFAVLTVNDECRDMMVKDYGFTEEAEAYIAAVLSTTSASFIIGDITRLGEDDTDRERFRVVTNPDGTATPVPLEEQSVRSEIIYETLYPMWSIEGIINRDVPSYDFIGYRDDPRVDTRYRAGW